MSRWIYNGISSDSGGGDGDGGDSVAAPTYNKEKVTEGQR